MRALGRVASVVVCSLCAPGISAQQNFPPFVEASATPGEVLLGEPVQLSSAGTTDPNPGDSLSFDWDFGDGTGSTDPNPAHVYAEPGFYSVTLTASDGQTQAASFVSVVVLAPTTPAPAARSDRLALGDGGASLWVVNPDSGSVSHLDTATFDVTEVAVGPEPQSLALSRDGARLFVACRGDGQLWRVDTAARSVLGQLAVGHRPFGVAVSPTDGRVLVTNEGDGSVWELDALGESVTARHQVGGEPRAIAITHDGARAFVSHFLTRGDAGRVTRITLASGQLAALPLVLDTSPDQASSGAGYPSLLGTLAIEPSGRRLWVGGLKANTDRGLYLSGQEMVPRNRLRGLLAPLDVATEQEVVARRIDTNDADSVSGVAFSPNGRFAYTVHQGAGTFSVYDLYEALTVDATDGGSVPFQRIDVGFAPQGVVVSPDGARAYVMSYLSRAIDVVDLSVPLAPVLSRSVSVAGDALSPHMLNGKRMFFVSREPVHSDQSYIACWSCHPDGGADGRSWDFTQFGEGVRNTIDLRGRAGVGHGPVHWSANFDEIQDFENDIVNGFGGTGLADDGEPPYPPLSPEHNAGRSEDLDDLALYVASLSHFVKSPHRAADGSLTEAALRGRALFFEADRLCADCHVPPRFTDSTLADDPRRFILHDVGTLGPASGGHLGGPLTGLDTPTLLGVWASPPYLHDGSAPDLETVLSDNAGDRHGVTSDLDAAELADLVAYLRSLDGSADEIPDGFVPKQIVLPELDAGVDAGALGEPGDAGLADAAPASRRDAAITDAGAGPAAGDAGDEGASDRDGAAADADAAEADLAADGDAAGCGCRLPAGPTPPAPWALLPLLLVFRRLLRPWRSRR